MAIGTGKQAAGSLLHTQSICRISSNLPFCAPKAFPKCLESEKFVERAQLQASPHCPTDLSLDAKGHPSMKSASDPVAFVVVSCDRYADLWDPFFHCLDKYWPDCPYPVYLVTNHKDYDKYGVTVIKVGNDKSYSDNLQIAISQLEESWAILWLEDVFISKRVDTRRLQAIIEEAQSLGVGYLKLSADLPLSYEQGTQLGIGPIPKGVRYRSAVGLSLYQIETLEKLLIPNATAWELDTSKISNELDVPFYALTRTAASRPPIIWINGVIKGRWNWPTINFLRKEGFASLLKGRPRLDLKGYLYVQAFLLHNFLFRALKKDWY